MPCRVSAIDRLRVEVADEQVGERVQGRLGPVALGLQGHLGAFAGTEGEDRQHALRGNGGLAGGTDGDDHRLGGRRRDEQRCRAGVQSGGGTDGDGTRGHGPSRYGSMVTLMAWPAATMSNASSARSSGSRSVIRSATGTAPDAMSRNACALCAGLEPLAPTIVSSR